MHCCQISYYKGKLKPARIKKSYYAIFSTTHYQITSDGKSKCNGEV